MHSFHEFRDQKLCLILESGASSSDDDASGEGDEEENDENEGTEENR